MRRVEFERGGQGRLAPLLSSRWLYQGGGCAATPPVEISVQYLRRARSSLRRACVDLFPPIPHTAPSSSLTSPSSVSGGSRKHVRLGDGGVET